MVSDNISEKIDADLLDIICEKYDIKFKRFAFIVKNVPRYRYELPMTRVDKTILNYGMMNVYIEKAVDDLYDIDYEVVWKINLKGFIKHINKSMTENYYKTFDFNKYKYQEVFFDKLRSVVSEKYQIELEIFKYGEYLKFISRVSLEPEKRVTFRLVTKGERDLIFIIKESTFPPEGLTILKQNLDAYMKSHKKPIREEIEEIASNTIEEFGGTLIPFTMYTINY